MKKSLYNRRFDCNHCGTLYRPKRSDQKFCSPSCRSSNHQMNKARDTAVKTAKPKVDNPTTMKHLGNSFLGSAGANAATQLMEKVGGVHNSDILKAIEKLQKSPNATNPNRPGEELQLLREIHRLLLEEKFKKESWMLNI
jgi:hypothetical protein